MVYIKYWSLLHRSWGSQTEVHRKLVAKTIESVKNQSFPGSVLFQVIRREVIGREKRIWLHLFVFSLPVSSIHLFLYDLVFVSKQSTVLCLFKDLEAFTDLPYFWYLFFQKIVSELCEVLKCTYHGMTFFIHVESKNIRWWTACIIPCAVGAHCVPSTKRFLPLPNIPWLPFPTQAFAFTIHSLNGTWVFLKKSHCDVPT